MKTQLELAQELLDSRLDAYYKRNPDGGCSDEIYKIAFSVAKQFKVNINDLYF